MVENDGKSEFSWSPIFSRNSQFHYDEHDGIPRVFKDVFFQEENIRKSWKEWWNFFLKKKHIRLEHWLKKSAEQVFLAMFHHGGIWCRHKDSGFSANFIRLILYQNKVLHIDVGGWNTLETVITTQKMHPPGVHGDLFGGDFYQMVSLATPKPWGSDKLTRLLAWFFKRVVEKPPMCWDSLWMNDQLDS